MILAATVVKSIEVSILLKLTIQYLHLMASKIPKNKQIYIFQSNAAQILTLLMCWFRHKNTWLYLGKHHFWLNMFIIPSVKMRISTKGSVTSSGPIGRLITDS